jgi:hypothetical protein
VLRHKLCECNEQCSLYGHLSVILLVIPASDECVKMGGGIATNRKVSEPITRNSSQFKKNEMMLERTRTMPTNLRVSMDPHSRSKYRNEDGMKTSEKMSYGAVSATRVGILGYTSMMLVSTKLEVMNVHGYQKLEPGTRVRYGVSGFESGCLSLEKRR